MKKLFNLCLMAFSFFMSILSVYAAPSANISVSKSQVEVGQSVTATITANNVATWQIYNFNGTGNTNGCEYKSEKVGYDENTNNVTKKFKITCTANSAGTIKFSYSAFFADNSYNKITPSDKVYVTVVPARPKSTNNNLKSLSIEGATITPEFKQDTLEYSAIVEAGTEKIVINAEKADGTASISGTGEQAVVEGDNKFEIKVTSESGNTKTYTLTVTVKEFAPIVVKVNGKEYTVVRKLEELTKPESFTESSLTIGEDTVPAFVNDKLKLTLVGLKDENGVVKLYSYNDGKYTRYYEFTSSVLTLNIIEMDKKLLPSGYSSFKVTLNEEEIEVYKLNKSSNFALVYAVDTKNGEKGLYQIDLKNNTYQLFNKDIEEKQDKTNNTNMIIIAALAGVILILFIALVSSKKKVKRIINKINNKKMESVKNKAIKESMEDSVKIEDEKKKSKK